MGERVEEGPRAGRARHRRGRRGAGRPRPMDGSTSSRMARRYMRRMPNQKTGMETPSCANSMHPPSIAVPRQMAAAIPSSTPSTMERSSATTATSRVAPSAARSRPRPAGSERSTAPCRPEAGRRSRRRGARNHGRSSPSARRMSRTASSRGVLAEKHDGRVPGQQEHDGEGDRDDAGHHRHEEREPPQGVRDHGARRRDARSAARPAGGPGRPGRSVPSSHFIPIAERIMPRASGVRFTASVWNTCSPGRRSRSTGARRR